MKIDELAASAGNASEFLKSLANPLRLRILCMIMDGEQPVGQIAKAAGASQSTVSQHLALMRREGLVVPRRDGQTIYYKMADKRVKRLFKVLSDLFCKTG